MEYEKDVRESIRTYREKVKAFRGLEADRIQRTAAIYQHKLALLKGKELEKRQGDLWDLLSQHHDQFVKTESGLGREFAWDRVCQICRDLESGEPCDVETLLAVIDCQVEIMEYHLEHRPGEELLLAAVGLSVIADDLALFCAPLPTERDAIFGAFSVLFGSSFSPSGPSLQFIVPEV